KAWRTYQLSWMEPIQPQPGMAVHTYFGPRLSLLGPCPSSKNTCSLKVCPELVSPLCPLMSQTGIECFTTSITVRAKTQTLVKSSTPPQSFKTILLVDDVDACRVATKWFLSNFGFGVDSARNAEEALALFNPELHDVVVTDHSMPGMTGAEMAHIIKLRSPST